MKLKYLRESNNLTQRELAEIMMVTSVTISFWENSRVVPHYRNIRCLNRIFGEGSLSVSDFTAQ